MASPLSASPATSQALEFSFNFSHPASTRPSVCAPVWVSLGAGRAWRAVAKSKSDIPVLSSAVRAGFPSPAEDYIEGNLDLNRHLIRHPAATFIVRVEGDSMTGAGIFSGDLLVVDRSLEPRDGHVVIAVVDGELTVKRLRRHTGEGGNRWRLVAEHPDYPPIDMPGADEGGETSAIWGVVTNAVRNLGT